MSEEQPQEPANAAPPAASSSDGPAPVPYSVFASKVAALQGATSQLEELRGQVAELEGYRGKVATLQQQLEAAQAQGPRRLALARAGASDDVSDYLLSRYEQRATDPEAPAFDAWLEQTKQATPAFFGSPSTTGDMQPPKPPTTSPEGGAGSPPPGSGRPVTAEDIAGMSDEQFRQFKANNGAAAPSWSVPWMTSPTK